MSDLGDNIKKLRKEKQYNQMELAKIIGVSQTSVAHYEAGTRQPTIETLIQLAQVFNVTIDNLIGFQFSVKKKDTKIYNQDELIDSLVGNLITKNEIKFMNTFKNNVFLLYPIDFIIENVLQSVMYKIGDLWEQGIINEADEHYASHIVRKAINYISNKGESIIKNRKAISFSISSEKHTLGIEMINTYLEYAGIDSIHLGNNISIRSIDKVITEFKPNYIFISITMPDNMNTLIHLIEYINDKHHMQIMIGVGGQGLLSNNDLKETSNVRIIKNIEELQKIISK